MRPEDERPFEREYTSVILRIGTIASISGDAKKATVNVPGGQIPNVPMLSGVAVTTVGTKVAILLDRDSALVIGNVK